MHAKALDWELIDESVLLKVRKVKNKLSTLDKNYHNFIDEIDNDILLKSIKACFKWWRARDSNPRPTPCEGVALPAGLTPHFNFKFCFNILLLSQKKH